MNKSGKLMVAIALARGQRRWKCFSNQQPTASVQWEAEGHLSTDR